jgi:outer membrane protein TolC
MTRHVRAGAFLAFIFIHLAGPGTPSQGQEQDQNVLTLQHVLQVARDNNPRLRASMERVEATRAREPGAGTLPDPTLQVGVMNLTIPEFSASMPASMAPVFGATQRVPVGGKLGLREEIARQSTDMDVAASEETWWEVRTQVATAFYRIYQVDRQTEVLEETLSLLQDFESIAKSMYAAGQGRQADVLRANVEVARMEAEIERMTAMRVGAAAQLNALLHRPSETPVPHPVLAPLPASVPDHETLMQSAEEHRPAVARLRTELSQAGTRRQLAHKEIWPDLTLGLQYGFGRMDGNYKGMGGASVGFSIPVHAGKRQLKSRDEAQALESMVEARLDETLASIDARIGQTLADLDQVRTLIRLYREEILPQARVTVQSSLSSYRVGAVDFMTLVDAQMALNRFQGEYFALVASYGTAVAQIEMTIGRDIQVTDELLLEAS